MGEKWSCDSGGETPWMILVQRGTTCMSVYYVYKFKIYSVLSTDAATTEMMHIYVQVELF